MATATSSVNSSRAEAAYDTDLSRRVLILTGIFRLLIAVAAILIAALQGNEMLLGGVYPMLFLGTACAYGLCAVILAMILQGERWHTRQIAWTQLVIDIIAITLLVHASGGIGSGLEALLIVFVISGATTLSPRGGYLAAAVAALAVLLEQSLSFAAGNASFAQFMPAGLSGAIMLALAAALQPFIRKITETEELARQRGIDLENLAQLNDYIIQNLREAILVVDEYQNVRLINQAAADRLAQPELKSGDHLSNASPQIFDLLRKWRADKLDPAREIPSFLSGDQATVINAHFAPLGGSRADGPVLIFLEDASLLAEKVQQSKLAALGRLSASIAHEIRNPIGALSHAGQLLKESPDIGPQDQRFLDIIQTNSKRVSEIVENILQLSRKETVKPRQIELDKWCRGFINEFVTTLELFEGQVRIVAGEKIDVQMDPGHLHQVVWNLCENAVKYASETAGAIAVEISYGRLARNGRPFLEVSDHGPGVPADMHDTVFEPFATGRTGGTGLGLYICRELCERNGGTLRYQPRKGGGSTFQLVFSDPERWET